MLLGQLLEDGEYISVSSLSVFSLDINGVVSSSKEVNAGYAFVCIEGLTTDGAKYVGESALRGASVVISSRIIPLCPLPYVIVKEPRRVLSYMLYRFYGKPTDKMRVYAITGTNGKTSSSVYLKNIFIETGLKTGYIGSLGVYIGNEPYKLSGERQGSMQTMTTPDPEQFYAVARDMCAGGVECLVIEASSHALKLDKLAPIRVRCGVFTNFSSEHLDFHTDIGDYLMSKCRLYELSERMCVNTDDAVCASTMGLYDVPALSYGIYDCSAEVRACDVSYCGLDGVSYTSVTQDAELNVRCLTPGEFSVYNSLAALCVARSEDIDDDVIIRALAATPSIDGRLEVIVRGNDPRGLYVIIDYAHTERALENLLLSVSNMRGPHQRIVTLFGCGGDRDKTKRAPMGRVASRYSDMVIVTEDNSRSEDPESIISDIMRGIDRTKNHKIIKDRKNAIEFAINNAERGDIILLVGKGHEDYEINADGIAYFSEKEIVYGLLSISTEEEVK